MNLRLGWLGAALLCVSTLLLVENRADAACDGGVPNGDVNVPAEECDDDNSMPGDGCAADCTVEPGYSCARPFDFLLGVDTEGGGNWDTSDPSGLIGTQQINTPTPAVATFGTDAKEHSYTFKIEVETSSDDDFIGFVLGWNVGDFSNPAADYLIIDWKQGDQSGATRGVRLLRVQGSGHAGGGTSSPFWNAPGGAIPSVTQVIRGTNFGATGWSDNTEYDFAVTYSDTSLVFSINGAEELNVDLTTLYPGGSPDGEIGFYGFSQEQVKYTIVAPTGPSICNRAPTLQNATVWTVTNSGNTDVDISPLYSDPDTHPLDSDSIVADTQPTNGTAAGPGGGAPANSIRVTPNNASVAAAYTFNYTACDNVARPSGCDSGTITVNYNDPPTVSDPADIDMPGSATSVLTLAQIHALTSQGTFQPGLVPGVFTVATTEAGVFGNNAASAQGGSCTVLGTNLIYAPPAVRPASDSCAVRVCETLPAGNLACGTATVTLVDPDTDDDGVCNGASAVAGVCIAGPDTEPNNPNVCGRDTDSDNCDDCAAGGTAPNPFNDGTDTDGDGLCNTGDPDDDGDGVCDGASAGTGCIAGPDSHPLDDERCLDTDADNCDDCSSSSFNPANDGPDEDGDGQCDAGDVDTDDDGVCDDGNAVQGVCVAGPDTAPFDPNVCLDSDGDSCDDCSSGTYAPNNDGPDADGEGVCDAGDVDDDNDGIIDTAEGGPFDPDGDNDNDGVPNYRDANDRGDGQPNTCESSGGVCDDAGADYDLDGDGIANHLDLDADNDGLLDTLESGHGAEDGGNGVVTCPGGFGTNGFCDALETAPESGIPDYNGDTAGPDEANDGDGDSAHDFLDIDSDNDGIFDSIEGNSACLDVAPFDGQCDAADDDGDGVANDIDDHNGFGDDGYPAPPNTDGTDGPDYLDTDSDDDGLNDIDEGNAQCANVNADDECDGPDNDGDGAADDASPTTPNSDGQGAADYRDLDSDDDGILDSVEGEGDTDGDGVADYLDLDSDNDGILDVVEGESGCLDDAPRDGRCDGPDNDGDGRADDATNDDPTDTDSDGQADFRDLDSDNDGASDLLEGGSACVDTAPQDSVCDSAVDGSGVPGDVGTGDPTDTDSDTVPNYQDLDSDNDGFFDNVEVGSGCADAVGNGVCDGPDTDNDGIVDSIDDGGNGFGDTAPQEPLNTDLLGDGADYVDLDSDEDGSPDVDDNLYCDDAAPADGMCDGADSDGDGILDDADFADGFGAERDWDQDGVPDTIDLDDDNDGILDADEGEGDTDGDGTPDTLDLDADNDGIPDVVEAGHGGADADGDGTVDCMTVGTNGFCDDLESAPDSGSANFQPENTDGDAVPDFQDLDSDNDSLSDLQEGGSGCVDVLPANGVCDGPDSDNDGVVDSVDQTDGNGIGGYTGPPDTDEDGTPGYRDLDSDNDGINDILEGPFGPDIDVNNDGRVDGGDSDGDGIRDAVDDSDGDGESDTTDDDPPVFGGGFGGVDTDGDGDQDHRDLDSDNDGASDTEEAGDLIDGTGPADSDDDGIPDFRDIDSDNDGVTDVADNCRITPNDDQADTIDRDGLGDACDPDGNGDNYADNVGIVGGSCTNSVGLGGGSLLFIVFALCFLRRRRRSGVFLGFILLCWSGMADAQPLPSEYSVERFRLSSDRAGILDVEWAAVPGHMTFDLGVWFGYADDPLNLYTTEEGQPRERVSSLVASRWGATLVGSFGLWNRLQIGLAVPTILSQENDPADFNMGPASLSGFGLGDLRVIPKVGLLRQESHFVNVAVILGVLLPTATSDDYAGESSVSFAPELAVSRSWSSGFRAGMNLGYQVRNQTMALDLEVDDEFFARAGVAYRFDARGGPPIELNTTFAMATPSEDFFGQFNRNYSEVKAGFAWDIFGPAVLFGAGGLGLGEGFGTPDWRAVFGMRFSRTQEEDPVPEIPKTPVDHDGDGLIAQDQCPHEPEDKDNFEDGNGCPDPDNDQDSVLDGDDECMNTPGLPAFQGCPDRDGDGVEDREDECPDEPGDKALKGCIKKVVQVTGSKIEVMDIVHFKTNRAVIREKSYGLLDNVAAVINGHPEISMIHVEGHTDDRGNDNYNKKLSQRRAQAVVDFLIEKGVDSARLEAHGYGEERPVDDNGTKEGRAANRRVEFKIVGRSDGVDLKRSGPTDDTIDN